jgi:hypothetical protein
MNKLKERLIDHLLAIDSIILKGNLPIGEEILLNEERNSLIVLLEKLEQKEKHEKTTGN